VLSDVLDAWIKQRDKGFDLKHDLLHSDGDLSRAAAAYALYGTTYANANGLPSFWPWPDWFNPEDRRSNLVRAAAFILSEIVRFDAEKGPLGSEFAAEMVKLANSESKYNGRWNSNDREASHWRIEDGKMFFIDDNGVEKLLLNQIDAIIKYYITAGKWFRCDENGKRIEEDK
jgi:hypothetical protein